ncbi:MAG: family 43 glycosylhydrolase [Lachnospiraceae bacterium]
MKGKVIRVFCMAVLITVMTAAFTGCSDDNRGGDTDSQQETGEENKNPGPEEMGLKAYYKMDEVGSVRLEDASGNGNDALVFGKNNMHTDYEEGAVFITDGAYFEIPSEVFKGEDTLSISIWLKNYSGAINTSAIYFGTGETMPVNYWLLNPSNTTGNLKSVMTDDNNQEEPYMTEVGISPSNAENGETGPVTGMGWNHYVTIITPTELTVYMNGEKIGTVSHTKKVRDFGDEIVSYIGKSAYAADATYTGFIKEVKIFDKEMSEDEIVEEYNRCKPEEMETNAAETNIFIADRADPYITKGSDGYYYFTASYPMYGANDSEGYDRIILRRSRTIEGLAEAEEKVIWDESESDTAHRFIWAPEIHEINGKWYVYFAASGQANNVWDINCHVIACDGSDPYNDTWTDKGKFQAVSGDTLPFTGFSLDMTYFECGGKHYVIWAQKVGESNVYMAPINPDEPWKTTGKAILLTKPEYYWERVSIPVNEGPAVMIHEGKVFVAFSASATGPEYCIGLMYADETADLMDIDSWTKVETPLLTSEDLIGEYGPGHNSFVQDENGNWVFVYHSRSEECYKGECGYGNEDPLYDPCRSARVRYVKWDDNGMPILNQ